jgi:choline-sulfatase
LNRRDFLKLAGLLSLGSSIPGLDRFVQPRNPLQGKLKNIIVIVFDAFSAYNIPIYGYERLTTPNIARLAKRAIVYHNHFAGGNFTSPGTASLLTGVLPWTHRAFRSNSKVAKPFESKTLFNVFRNHYRITYTHNAWAYTLLRQFRHDIDELIPLGQLLLLNSFDRTVRNLFKNDDDIASVSLLRATKFQEQGQAYSLFLSHLYEAYEEKKNKKLQPLFPRGVPIAGTDDFILETATETTWKRLADIPQPFLAYFHFLPPHAPYRTSREFFNAFKDDGYTPLAKPPDLFAKFDNATLPTKRREYDEFILYCDKEFGKLYDHLESSGVLEDSLLVLTSDHGEMNERGISGHMTNSLYQPILRIPLIIFEPGRQTGMDIYEPTSAIDLLPTLAHLSGEPVPDWTEGVILPPFNSASHIPDRNIYIIRANRNEQFAPFTIASTILVKENYKLHYYFGYPEVPADGLIRLFDIQSDPEEMIELSKSKPDVVSELLHEMKTKLKEVDKPYL